MSVDSVVPGAMRKEGRKEAADDGGGGIVADDCHSAPRGARKSKYDSAHCFSVSTV